jgi:hypothetical protein
MAASVKVGSREPMPVDLTRGIGLSSKKLPNLRAEDGFSDAPRPLRLFLRTFPLSLLFC